jgi:hypothetical protein
MSSVATLPSSRGKFGLVCFKWTPLFGLLRRQRHEPVLSAGIAFKEFWHSSTWSGTYFGVGWGVDKLISGAQSWRAWNLKVAQVVTFRPGGDQVIRSWPTWAILGSPFPNRDSLTRHLSTYLYVHIFVCCLLRGSVTRFHRNLKSNGSAGIPM